MQNWLYPRDDDIISSLPTPKFSDLSDHMFSDLTVIRRLLTSDTAPELLRNKLALRSDESIRVTLGTER